MEIRTAFGPRKSAFSGMLVGEQTEEGPLFEEPIPRTDSGQDRMPFALAVGLAATSAILWVTALFDRLLGNTHSLDQQDASWDRDD